MIDHAPDTRLAHVKDWVFDLDNTLYPSGSNLFSQIGDKMTLFIRELLQVEEEEATKLRRDLYLEYGTTLAGLMARYDIDANAFLDKVHDIDYSWIDADPRLGDMIAGLPGRKFIFTNGDRKHAERTARQLGILDHFDDIFDIVAADLVPKPAREPYDKFMALHKIAGPNAAMFEDLPRNLIEPKKLGMQTVLIVPKNLEEEVGEAIHNTNPYEHDYIDFVTDDIGGFLGDILGK
ncbi:pyrimidine 5'-nucleotidase [Limoniibacter endophyticus]|uniref:Pyrimidine 5'-nucleotidase n=1 Tax=Limoniibacter endophyticus TaxID=1565040 RepID=A0A8J3GG93_9HYPH|nr:pyrimidine 5'-nucleotidase [Limoniibacter endophyticus]GHC67368.1 pyrimidine 5'-nucleotidase [Limoniibacter endophyticus]